MNTDCSADEDVTWETTAFGVFLVVGTVVSYLPQLIKIPWYRSTKGFSHLYVFIGMWFSWSEATNALIFNYYQMNVCCPLVGFWKCNNALLAMYQVVAIASSVTVMYFFFSLFYDSDQPDPEDESSTNISDEEKTDTIPYDLMSASLTLDKKVDTPDEDLSPFPEFVVKRIPVLKRCSGKWFVRIVFLSMQLLFICCLAMGYAMIELLGSDSPVVHYYATSFGGVASVATLVQLLPQIYTTYCTKGSGALSFLMLLLQCPGNFLTVAFQILASANISTWIPFLVAGVQQVVLLALLTWYDYIKKPYLRYRAKKLRDEFGISEEDPLLASERTEVVAKGDRTSSDSQVEE